MGVKLKPHREDLEHGLQKEICTFLDFQSATLPMLYFAVPNALKFLSTLKDTRRISAAYAKMRAEGFKDGVSEKGEEMYKVRVDSVNFRCAKKPKRKLVQRQGYKAHCVYILVTAQNE